MGHGRPRRQLKCLAVEGVGNSDPGFVCHFEIDRSRYRPAEQLHRIVAIGPGAASHYDRRFGHIRIEHVLAMLRRVLPAFEKALSELGGRNAVGAVDLRDVLRNDAVFVSKSLGACRRFGAVGRMTVLAGARHEICKVARGARELRCVTGRREILLTAEFVGRGDDAPLNFGRIGACVASPARGGTGLSERRLSDQYAGRQCKPGWNFTWHRPPLRAR